LWSFENLPWAMFDGATTDGARSAGDFGCLTIRPAPHVHASEGSNEDGSTLTSTQPRTSWACQLAARDAPSASLSQAMIDPCAAHFTLHSASPLTPTLHVRPADRPQRRK
jgi:hypothetical protein